MERYTNRSMGTLEMELFMGRRGTGRINQILCEENASDQRQQYITYRQLTSDCGKTWEALIQRITDESYIFQCVRKCGGGETHEDRDEESVRRM